MKRRLISTLLVCLLLTSFLSVAAGDTPPTESGFQAVTIASGYESNVTLTPLTAAGNAVAADDGFKRQGQQGIARQNRGCLVVRLVAGQPPAAEVVIVHRRQVVMDKAVAVRHFQGTGGGQPFVAARAEKRVMELTENADGEPELRDFARAPETVDAEEDE